MHGRLKVKTTAEQQEAKRKEREKKLQIYTAGTEKAFQKRKANEYDDEALTVSSKLLCENPDFYTLWNFRKEIVLHMSKEKNESDLQQLLENELLLVEDCLRKNPKSYGAWHHRTWSLELMPQPNWDREIYLCNKFLDLDERNFHCWHYRRFVCRKASITLSDELDFTTKKIEGNFSNYSAWHYRSCLLPIVHPGNSLGTVKEEKLLEEYELVQNAAFTDPNDQSVWFYHCWLLGRGQKPLQIDLVCYSKSVQRVIIQLSKPVLLSDIADNLRVVINDNDLDVQWHMPSSLKFASSVWFCTVLLDGSNCGDNDITLTISLSLLGIKDELKCRLNSVNDEAWTYRENNKSNTFRDERSATTTAVLEQELQSCTQLQELEPDNKWNLFTIVLLMRAIHSQQYDASIFECLDQLVTIDYKRKNYFLDLKSRFVLQNTIEQVDVSEKVSLANKQLTSLHHMDYFVLTKDMDLSFNLLTSVHGLCHLLCIKHLNLSNNNISNCDGLGSLLNLELLSLENNKIDSIIDLSDLASCQNLHCLCINGNPLTEDEDYSHKLKELLPKVTEIL